MNVIVTGATGFLGVPLCARLQSEGCGVTTITRDTERARAKLGDTAARHFHWEETNAWKPLVAEADAVFHLAGAPVAQRWTLEFKESILSSRIETARALAEAKPRGVFISASGVGWYGGDPQRVVTEDDTVSGTDFLAEVCRGWEDAAREAEATASRLVLLRIGAVLGHGGGMLNSMLNPPVVPFSPWKLGLGGPLGSGKQWVSWIHQEDMSRLFLHALHTEALTGPVNAVTPNPVTNAQFSSELGRAMHRPALTPVPAAALKLLLGEFGGHVLCGQRVMPLRAQETGFRFRFPELTAALRDLLAR